MVTIGTNVLVMWTGFDFLMMGVVVVPEYSLFTPSVLVDIYDCVREALLSLDSFVDLEATAIKKEIFSLDTCPIARGRQRPGGKLRDRVYARPRRERALYSLQMVVNVHSALIPLPTRDLAHFGGAQVEEV